MVSIVKHLNHFSEDTRQLISLIHDASGKEIEVRVGTLGEDLSPDDAPLYCDVDEIGGRIFIPSQDYFHSEHYNEGAVIHELLHIRRFLVDKIPQIRSKNPFPETHVSRYWATIDNQIEHLIVIPEELSYRQERRQRWLTKMHNALANLSKSDSSSNHKERNALMYYLQIKLALPDQNLLATSERILQDLNIHERAENIIRDVEPALKSKERLTNLLFDHLGLSKENARFFYIIDVNEETCRWAPLE